MWVHVCQGHTGAHAHGGGHGKIGVFGWFEMRCPHSLSQLSTWSSGGGCLGRIRSLALLEEVMSLGTGFEVSKTAILNVFSLLSLWFEM